MDELEREREAAWYATLPTMFGSAAALFTDPAGRVLLVKPNYRDHWSLPGGILEHGEPPHDGCRREVEEELGIAVIPGPLLVIAWTPPDADRPKPIVSFVFDGGVLDGDAHLALGVLDGDAHLALQEEELDEYRFIEAGELAGYLPAFLVARVTAALRGRAAGAPVYLPSECPPGQGSPGPL